MANVIFKFGTKAQYDALVTKDINTLYWLTDVLELRKGDALYGVGSEATSLASGLMSAADKAKLDELSNSAVLSLTPVDSTIVVADAENGKTVGVNLSKVEGNILTIKDDGLFAKVESVPLESVTGLKEHLDAIERDTSELKPVAKADFNTEQFEIDENNIFSLVGVDAKIVSYRNQTLDEALPALFVTRKYEITNGLFDDTLVNYRDGEIRVMFAKNSPFVKQQVGPTGNQNTYYMGFRAYAPDDATNFKEDTAEVIADNTLYSFTGNDFAGVDEYGRKYSVVWLPVAAYDATANTWNYYGNKSSAEKFIGWYYSVEWYDAVGTKIGADTIRINLSNEDCHTSTPPYFMHQYAKVEDIQVVENAMKWQDI